MSWLFITFYCSPEYKRFGLASLLRPSCFVLYEPLDGRHGGFMNHEYLPYAAKEFSISDCSQTKACFPRGPRIDLRRQLALILSVLVDFDWLGRPTSADL